MMELNSDGRVYPFGYSDAAVGLMQNRTAAANAGFLLPELKSDMAVLDIGCGPGSITVGLAEQVPNGRAVGLDIEPSQIELAQARATEMGLSNCTFDVGSVFSLPYPDASFDVVFGHTIIMQFSDPGPVFAEISRVLKPGGLVALRELDFGASLYGPAESALETVFATLRRSILENDGYPDVGRDLAWLCGQAGFEVTAAKPVYFSAPMAARAGMYAAVGNLWRQADFVGDAVESGWLTEAQRADVQERLEVEAKDAGFISGTTYIEVLARLPE